MRFILFLAAWAAAGSAILNPAPTPPASNGKTCTVKALGNKRDDTPQILKAFEECNNGGTIVFPADQSYWIATKLNPVIHDVTIEWKGLWQMSDDLKYWRNNSYPVTYQNHNAGIVFSGERIHINGYRTGGINGNGNSWYDDEKTVTQPGRPMPFVFWNTSDVYVEHFFVKEPPLWSVNVMNGTNMLFDDILVNATALKAPYGKNWVQNTDGFDTMDSNNVNLTNFYYQGGDDCIAIKPRSYNVFIENVTCHGGNGIAIGSLGQYLEDCSVINVTIKDVNILINNKDMHNAAYIKTWVGQLVPQNNYESDFQPRGGGWGVVQNINFENFFIQGSANGPQINQDSGNNGSYSGSSLMEISNIAFKNFTGYLDVSGNRTAAVSCSKVKPCFNIAFWDMSLAPGLNSTPIGAAGTCNYIATNGVSGITGMGCS